MSISETERILGGLSSEELREYMVSVSGLYKRYVPVPSGTPLEPLKFSPLGRFALPDYPAMSFAEEFDICRAERGQELGTTASPSGYEQTYEIDMVTVFSARKFADDYPETQEEIYRAGGETKYDVSHEMVRIIRKRMGGDVCGIESVSVSGYVQGRDDATCIHMWQDASGQIHHREDRYWNGETE